MSVLAKTAHDLGAEPFPASTLVTLSSLDASSRIVVDDRLLAVVAKLDSFKLVKTVPELPGLSAIICEDIDTSKTGIGIGSRFESGGGDVVAKHPMESSLPVMKMKKHVASKPSLMPPLDAVLPDYLLCNITAEIYLKGGNYKSFLKLLMDSIKRVAEEMLCPVKFEHNMRVSKACNNQICNNSCFIHHDWLLTGCCYY